MPQIFFTDYVTPGASKMLLVRDFGWHHLPTNIDRSEGIGPFYQILISVSGKGQFTHNDIVSELPPSTLLFSRPNESLVYSSIGDSWETVFIVFDGILASQLTEGIDSGVFVLHNDLFVKTVRRILDMSEEARQELAASLLYTLLLDLKDESPLLSAKQRYSESGVFAARELICTRFFDSSLTVEEIAHAARLSRRSLERRFRAAFQASPVQYLMNRRYEAAIYYAKCYPYKSYSEIVRMSGFSDLDSFNRYRKKRAKAYLRASRRYSNIFSRYEAEKEPTETEECFCIPQASLVPLRLHRAEILKNSRFITEEPNRYHLFLALSGTASIRCLAERHILKQNCFFLFKPTDLAFSVETDGQLLRLSFSSELDLFMLSGDIKKANATKQQEKLITAETQKLCTPLSTAEASVHLMFFLLLLHQCTRQSDLSERTEQKDDRIEAMLRYIAENCTKDLSLDTVAEKCNVSPAYFCRLFRKITGKSFTAYLTEKRIQYAVELFVTHPEIKSSEAARLCGYASYNIFLHNFRKVFGISPKDFRMKGFDADR